MNKFAASDGTDPLLRSLRNGLVSDRLGREAHKRLNPDWVEGARRLVEDWCQSL